MHFSFQPKGQWSQLNEKATEIFGAELGTANVQIRVFANCSQAVLEAALGFFQQFPFKKKFFYFKNLDPHFDLAITALSKQGLIGKALEISDMSKPESWIDQLDREAGIFLYSYDNPITGTLFQTEVLDRTLKEKSIFKITISHSKHLCQITPPAIDRGEIHVQQMPFNLCKGIALAYVGERGRFGAITAEASTPCTEADLSALPTELKQLAHVSNQASLKIKEIEGALGADFKLSLPDQSERLLDRVQFFFDDIDGHAFINLLAEELSLEGEVPLQPPGRDIRFETPSLTRWGGLKTMDWLKAHGFEANAIRGMIILYPAFFLSISVAELKSLLLNIKSKVLLLQNGEV